MKDLSLFFRRAPAVEFRGPAYRLCVSLYRNRTLSMSGAWNRGGRYNIRNYFGALYTSLDLATAHAEMCRYFTVEPDCGLTQAVIDLELTRVVDLTGRGLLRRIGIGLVDLVHESHAVCQGFWLRAWESGVEGLLVPPAAVHGRKNLVVLLDNQQTGWSIRLRRLEAAKLLTPVRTAPALRPPESS